MRAGYVIRSKDLWKRYYKYGGEDEYGLPSYNAVDRIEDATIFNNYREILDRLNSHKSKYDEECLLTGKMFFEYGIEIIHVEYEIDEESEDKQ